MKRVVLITLALALGSTLAVFSTGTQQAAAPQSKTTLTYWDMAWGPADSYPKASADVVSNFNTANPAIEVKLQIVNWDSWYEKFITSITAGSGPDVATSSSAAPFLFSRMGELEDLSEVLARWKKEKTYNDMLQSSYDYYFMNGIQAAIPWQVDSRCFYYRKDVFNKFGLTADPKDWFEFIETLKVIRDKSGIIPLVFGGGGNMMKHLAYQLSIYNDVGMVDKKMNADFLNPKWTRIFEFMNTLAAQQVISPGTIGYGDLEAAKLYFSGKAAVSFSTLSPEVLSYPEVATTSGILGVFTGPGSNTKRSSSFVNPIMVFKKDESTRDASLSFVDWWSKNNLALFSDGKCNSMPTRFSQLKDPYFASSWVWQEAAEKILPYNVSGGVYPLTSEYPGFSALNGERVAGSALQEVLLAGGKADFEEIQRAMNTKVEKLLADAKK